MKKLTILVSVLFLCSCASAPPKEKPFTVDLKAPHYAAGMAEAYFDRFMAIGKPKKGDITVTYYPTEDAVCLNFKDLQFINCSQFWDRNGREAFIDAFERYQEDYEQRLLVKGGSRKAKEVYGTVPGYFAWKKTPISVQAHGVSRIKLGYQIKDQAAFFSTTQMEVVYKSNVSERDNQTYSTTTMYFTRAQAESLIELINQEYLQSLRSPDLPKRTGGEDVDEYF